LIDLNPRDRVQTAKRRPTVPIADYAIQPLRRAFDARQSNFVIERGGEQVKSIKKAFRAASERSNVHATPYTLRHTGAVRRVADSISKMESAQFAGRAATKRPRSTMPILIAVPFDGHPMRPRSTKDEVQSNLRRLSISPKGMADFCGLDGRRERIPDQFFSGAKLLKTRDRNRGVYT